MYRNIGYLIKNLYLDTEILFEMANMRYVKYAIVTVLFVSLISIAPSISHSQLVETTVEVDKSSYSIGETVSIGGIVPKVVDGVPVVIQVFNPRNVLYSIDQVMPAADGSYSSIANIGGKLGITGTYTDRFHAV